MSKSKPMFLLLLALTVGGLLAACATIIDGGETKPVSITSQPSGKKFSIENERGQIVQTGITPAIINLPRSDGSYFGSTRYKVTLHDSGNSKEVKSRVTGWYIAGNLMFAALISWLIVWTP